MQNYVTIQYVNGGFIITTSIFESDDGKVTPRITTEVVTSPGKLIKAIRTITDELSLLPKKADDEATE